MSTCADVGSFIESKTSVVQTSNVGFTSEVSDYLVVHTGPGRSRVTVMNEVDATLTAPVGKWSASFFGRGLLSTWHCQYKCAVKKF